MVARLRHGSIVLASVLGIVVGVSAALPGEAPAGHWDVTCNGHGFVHGEDTNDGSFFARVDSGPCNGSSQCNLYQFGSALGYAASAPGQTCNNWSRNYGNYQECPGWANVSLSGHFSLHRHNAHNWCG